ncbi:hypothetical protein [Amycolatopsis samaneae]|uniref:Uncharacterized protein n=1 Tax=Amycolatopsis samaneae TaxID=664691 RepID=A0ABW5GFW2_9PSEU
MTAVPARIGLLSSEYVVRGTTAAAQASRLDTVARLELGPALERALAGTFEDDEAVYVLRDVHAELALRADAPDVARHWAEALAVAIVETVATGDGARLVKFDDEPAFLAAYLADHVRGEAAGHWYFGSLRQFHELPIGEVLRELAADVSADRVFAALHRQGRLREVLAAVPVSVLSGLYGERGAAADDLAGLWPLLVAATRIAGAWGLWASAPLTALEVARRYRPRPVPDWRDPAALTAIVVDVLRSLEEIRRPAGPPPPSLADEFGWLDPRHLARGLTGTPSPHRRPSDREAEILAVVRAAVAGLGPLRAGPVARILVRGAVFAGNPEWTGDPLAETVLARVLEESTVDTAGEAGSPGFEDTPCAGLLVLLRGVADLGLPAMFARLGLGDALTPALLAVGTRLGGAEPVDPAILAFAGLPADVERETRRWQAVESEHGEAVDRELGAVLHGLRIGSVAGTNLTERLARAVLAAWSRWLGRCAGLPEKDLLTHFVRRPGRLSWPPRELRVELDSRILDVVLRQAGYDRPIESVPWLGDRRVSFRLGDT